MHESLSGFARAAPSRCPRPWVVRQASGMWDNTVLIFTSDNGAPGSHFNSTAMSNEPLRGEKGQLWEGGTHVPAFVVAGKGVSLPAAGTLYSGLLHAVDW